MSVRIAASVLNADWTRLGEQIRELEGAGVDMIHADVMDGHFVNNISFGPAMVSAMRRCTSLPLDAHLMISDPDAYVPEFVKAGADLVTVHVEACPDPRRTLAEIRRLGARPGITLSPPTPVDRVLSLLDLADLVLVMTVNPGFGGQPFSSETLPKVRSIRDRLAALGRQAEIQADGGINAATAPLATAAGANNLVVGTYLFRHPGGIKRAVAELRKALGE